MDWPDDTLALMGRELQPLSPLCKVFAPVRYPVTVPVDAAGEPSLFTVMLPVPPRHLEQAFADDPHEQALNALRAVRLARAHARRAGLETT